MRRPPAALSAAVSIATVLGLAACDGNGSGWLPPERAPRAEAPTISLGLGQAATLHGPDGLELSASVDFTRRPVVPIGLSPETATFLEVHLTVTNTGGVPFSGVLSDGARLTVVPGGPLVPIPTETIPVEIPLSGGVDFGAPVTIEPDAPPFRGRVVFRVNPEVDLDSFSLTLPDGRETAEWAL